MLVTSCERVRGHATSDLKGKLDLNELFWDNIALFLKKGLIFIGNILSFPGHILRLHPHIKTIIESLKKIPQSWARGRKQAHNKKIKMLFYLDRHLKIFFHVSFIFERNSKKLFLSTGMREAWLCEKNKSSLKNHTFTWKTKTKISFFIFKRKARIRVFSKEIYCIQMFIIGNFSMKINYVRIANVSESKFACYKFYQIKIWFILRYCFLSFLLYVYCIVSEE